MNDERVLFGHKFDYLHNKVAYWKLYPFLVHIINLGVDCTFANFNQMRANRISKNECKGNRILLNISIRNNCLGKTFMYFSL